MVQKIIRVGNSVAVTIPKKTMEEKNLNVGDSVNIEIDSAKNPKKTTITPEFKKWVDKYIEDNRPALEELANKWPSIQLLMR